ncbi:hypothetical protein [Nocardia abscessus]|uniref:hypothetical protein n=1 Tax=Nocardia abscessus TaxID=120957 RepID=UPI002456B937|nr:hypothetical protein [Nocardia abscessus]
MEEVEVVVAHHERATLRVGDVFLKIDADQTHTDVEIEAMAMAPIPTPQILWHKPPVLALAALPGTALGRLGEPSTASSAAWAAAGAAARMLHDAPLPPWPGRSLVEFTTQLDDECATGLRARAEAKLVEVDAKLAELTAVRDTLRAALEAGCDDLIACSESPCCPVPFTDEHGSTTSQRRFPPIAASTRVASASRTSTWLSGTSTRITSPAPVASKVKAKNEQQPDSRAARSRPLGSESAASSRSSRVRDGRSVRRTDSEEGVIVVMTSR